MIAGASSPEQRYQRDLVFRAIVHVVHQLETNPMFKHLGQTLITCAQSQQLTAEDIRHYSQLAAAFCETFAVREGMRTPRLHLHFDPKD